MKSQHTRQSSTASGVFNPALANAASASAIWARAPPVLQTQPTADTLDSSLPGFGAIEMAHMSGGTAADVRTAFEKTGGAKEGASERRQAKSFGKAQS